MKFTIEESIPEQIPPNLYMNCIFNGVEECETQNGIALKWKFQTNDGKVITDLSDKGRATTKNKLGKFLCGLAKQSITAGVSIDPDDYIGMKYAVNVVSKDGKSKIDGITKM